MHPNAVGLLIKSLKFQPLNGLGPRSEMLQPVEVLLGEVKGGVVASRCGRVQAPIQDKAILGQIGPQNQRPWESGTFAATNLANHRCIIIWRMEMGRGVSDGCTKAAQNIEVQKRPMFWCGRPGARHAFRSTLQRAVDLGVLW